MIYTAPYVMILSGQIHYVGGGWALEIETFLGSVKWHHDVGECHFGPKKMPPAR
jgi:hypothetical protein